MEKILFRFIKLVFQVLIIYSVISTAISSSERPRPRGVSLSKASLYSPGKNFTCLDGTQTIPFTRVNDDYCDCYDATDEPGTAACPHGVFHCTNAGHKPMYIPSNRVNDGICDCCDGTDEYASDKCQNSCIELGRTAREEALRRAELIKAGKQIRADYVQKGTLLKQEKESKLKELQKTKDEAERIRAEKEALKKDAEDLENAALDYYRKLEEEEKKKRSEEEASKNRAEAKETFERFDSNQDGALDITELQTRTVFDKNADGIVTEDEAKFFLNNKDSVHFDEFLNDCWSTVKPYILMNAAEYKPPSDDSTDDATETADLQDDGEQEHEDENQEDEEDAETESLDEESADSTTEGTSVVYDDETQKLIDQANNARNDYQDADQQVRDVENEIKDIQSYLEKDFGPEEEFAVLQGQCFEYQDNEYIYKLCPFDKTSQHPKSSSSETLLGNWGRWSGPENNKYSQMSYEGGQSCWNGPQRSTIVRINCGGENKLTSVTEPNKCEYFYEFITPAACQEISVDPHEGLHDEL